MKADTVKQAQGASKRGLSDLSLLRERLVRMIKVHLSIRRYLLSTWQGFIEMS